MAREGWSSISSAISTFRPRLLESSNRSLNRTLSKLPLENLPYGRSLTARLGASIDLGTRGSSSNDIERRGGEMWKLSSSVSWIGIDNRGFGISGDASWASLWGESDSSIVVSSRPGYFKGSTI